MVEVVDTGINQQMVQLLLQWINHLWNIEQLVFLQHIKVINYLMLCKIEWDRKNYFYSICRQAHSKVYGSNNFYLCCLFSLVLFVYQLKYLFWVMIFTMIVRTKTNGDPSLSPWLVTHLDPPTSHHVTKWSWWGKSCCSLLLLLLDVSPWWSPAYLTPLSLNMIWRILSDFSPQLGLLEDIRSKWFALIF